MPTPRLAPLPTDTPPPASVRSRAGGSVHPSGSERHLVDADRPTGSLSFAALRRIAAGLARVQQPAPVPEGTRHPRSTPLATTPFYEAWLVTWPPGTGVESVGRANGRSVLHVVGGELTEASWDRSSADGPVVRALGSGRSIDIGPSDVHGMWNRSGSEVTTVHVYSPPRVPTAPVDPDGWATGDDPGPPDERRTTPLVLVPPSP